MEEAGGEVEDDRVVLARNVSAEGRSRAFVGGAAVPVSALAELAEPLVAVHGQSDQHRLLQARAQREALDRFGGAAVATLLARLRRRCTPGSRARERELDEVVTTRARAGPRGRPAAVRARRDRGRLARSRARTPRWPRRRRGSGYADTLRTAAEQAREALSSEEGQPDALATTVGRADRCSRACASTTPRPASWPTGWPRCTYLLSDVAADVASYAARLETDPARLAAVSERRAALTALTRKYGETIDEVLAWAEAAARLPDLDDTDERIEQLRAERDDLRAELGEAAGDAVAARTEAAARLAADGDRGAGAAGDAARPVEVAVTPARGRARRGRHRTGPRVGDRRLRLRASGVDEVELLLAANTGAEPRPLPRAPPAASCPG